MRYADEFYENKFNISSYTRLQGIQLSANDNQKINAFYQSRTKLMLC